MEQQAPDSYEFGPYRLIPAEGLLLRDGEPVALPPKVVDTLALLVERHGHVVTKEEFMAAVWPDTFVEETNLTHNISLLRKTLGEDSEDEQYIDTIPKRGYRFVAPITVIDDESDPLPDAIEETPAPHSPGHGSSLRIAPWVAIGVLVLLAVGAGYWTWRQSRRGPTAVRSLAVLPFAGLASGELDVDYLGLGLADQLIGKLAGSERIVVRPTSAVRAFAGQPRDVVEIGRALRVDAVVDGALQHDGQRVRLSAQLVRVADGTTLWADTFEADAGDVYTLQDSLADQLADTLEIQLGDEQAAGFRSTPNADAYRLYLQGRYAWNRRTPESLRQSVAFFQQALAQDPEFALAYSGLADAYNLQADYGLRPPQDAYSLAKAAAHRALELDDSLAEAHTALAFALLYNDWDWQGAEREFDRAITLSPNYASAHQWSAYPLIVQGRFDEAQARIERAQVLDPVSPIIRTNLALFHYQARRPDRAISICHRTLELDPNFHVAHWILGLALAQDGRLEEAVTVLERARRLSDHSPDVTAALAWAYGRAGRREEAETLLAELREMSARRYVPAYLLAEVHIGLGEFDAAFHWLEIALRERQPYLLYLAVEPTLDPIRSDPRYRELQRRAGLPAI